MKKKAISGYLTCVAPMVATGKALLTCEIEAEDWSYCLACPSAFLPKAGSSAGQAVGTIFSLNLACKESFRKQLKWVSFVELWSECRVFDEIWSEHFDCSTFDRIVDIKGFTKLPKQRKNQTRNRAENKINSSIGSPRKIISRPIKMFQLSLSLSIIWTPL